MKQPFIFFLFIITQSMLTGQTCLTSSINEPTLIQVLAKDVIVPDEITITCDGVVFELQADYIDTPPFGTHQAAVYTAALVCEEICADIDPLTMRMDITQGAIMNADWVPFNYYLYFNDSPEYEWPYCGTDITIPLLDADDGGSFNLVINGQVTTYSNVDEITFSVQPWDIFHFESINESFVMGCGFIECDDVLDLDKLIGQNEENEGNEEDGEDAKVEYYNLLGQRVNSGEGLVLEIVKRWGKIKGSILVFIQE